MLQTNVTRLLQKTGIPFQVHEYEVDESDLSGEHIAQTLNVDPSQMFKTLVLHGEKGYLVCCLPSSNELDLKKVAKAAGDKKVAMIPMKTLKETTGYIRGGCSPIGMKKAFPTFMDETAMLFDEIYINAGQRGAMLVLPPEPLCQLIGAKLCDLIQY